MQHQKQESRQEIIAFVDRYYAENGKAPTIREIAEGTSISRSGVQRYLKAMDANGMIRYGRRSIETPRIRDSFGGKTSVGIIGTIPCGPLTEEAEAVEGYVDLPSLIFGKGDMYLLHASGDSMTGAGIDDGDLVLIRKQEEAHHGDIVVAYVEGEGNTLKRFHQYGNTVFLHPENPKYRDIPVQDCKIQGIAIKVIKELV